MMEAITVESNFCRILFEISFILYLFKGEHMFVVSHAGFRLKGGGT